MRFLLVAMMILGSAIAQAEGMQLPDAQISAKTLGGTVLLIDMKHSLVIEGHEQAAMNKELGEKTRKELFKDMILSTKASQLKKTYGGKKHQMTNDVISRYEKLVTIQEKLSMN